MTSNLFTKAACFTDLHYGGKNNSTTHLQDCNEYIDWFIATAKANNCDTCIFLGDWHNNRNTMNLVVMDASIASLERLASSFTNFFWIPGNHDLFYKEKRTVHSSMFGKFIPNMTIVDQIITTGNVTLAPWLVGNEWKAIKDCDSRYMFGHFELPFFYMNSLVQMPDHGGLTPDQFAKQELVFSGHFHKRQNKDKVWYIGNAFPHNFSDVGDVDRGMMILEWGGAPQFINWTNCPKYQVMKLSNLLDDHTSLSASKLHVRVHLDIDITYEEAAVIKETFVKEYGIREMSLVVHKHNVDLDTDLDDIQISSVDQVVSSTLLQVESGKFDKTKLLEMYQEL